MILLYHLLFFFGKKFWGEKILIAYDKDNTGNIPKINREYWSYYKNLKKPSRIISENLYSLTFFPFIILLLYIIIKFQISNLIKLILAHI